MSRKGAKNSKLPELAKASHPRKGGHARSAKKAIPDSGDSSQQLADLTSANRQLKRKIFDLYTIFEISRNFNAVLDYNTLLDSFLLTSLAQVGASRAAIYIKQTKQAEEFHLVKTKGFDSPPAGKRAFVDGTGLTTYLTRLNRPVPTGDLLNEITTDTEEEILRAFHPGLVVPLIYQTRLSGVFVVTDKISDRDFQLDDTEFLSILGNQIAVAIENARLYEDERRATTLLRATQQQLVDTERLAALGEMSAKIAHEVNNPLGIIKNYLLLLERSLKSDERSEELVKVVSQEIDRIARIVSQLLDFHRPSGNMFNQIQVETVLTDILTLMERQFENYKVTVNSQINGDIPPVEGSEENLKQVFMNLIINACDVMPKGGVLSITVSSEGEQVKIEFCDTGPGIDPEIIPRIFEPFFTTKEPGKGTGLGLSVCYGIIKNHKGSITYRNLNPGGCFQITLPTSGETQD